MELRKSRLIPLVCFIVVLVAYLFTAKIYVPRIVQNEIVKFSDERGVDLSVRSVSFGLLSGLVLSDARLGDSVSVGKIKMHPSYFPLIFSGEIFIKSILVDRPLVRIDDKLPENIIKIQKGGKKEPGRKIEIGNIEIDDLIINAGDSEYSLSELDIEMPYRGETENSIKLTGSLENDSLRQEVGFISDIEFNKDKSLKIDLAFTDLKKGEITGFLRFPRDLSIYITAEIDYSDGLDSVGKLTVINSLSYPG